MANPPIHWAWNAAGPLPLAGVDKGARRVPGAESLLTVALYPADRLGTVFAYLDHW
jgi:hypothetical protein